MKQCQKGTEAHNLQLNRYYLVKEKINRRVKFVTCFVEVNYNILNNYLFTRCMFKVLKSVGLNGHLSKIPLIDRLCHFVQRCVSKVCVNGSTMFNIII